MVTWASQISRFFYLTQDSAVLQANMGLTFTGKDADFSDRMADIPGQGLGPD